MRLPAIRSQKQRKTTLPKSCARRGAPGTHHVIPLYESASSKKSETTASTMLVTIVNPAHPDELASPLDS